ncbi:MAG: VIT and vWA domain-containing protein, partial [Myxococcales bacterium]
MYLRPTTLALASVVLFGLSTATTSHAAGTLVPVGSTAAAPLLVDHGVRVTLNNGFARTQVTQLFENAASTALDATYEFPVPKGAALADVSIQVGERTMHGEVIARAQAEQAYAAAQASGQQAGLATQDSYQTFQFKIANIPAGGQALMSFVYYEPLLIDAAVGRYLYPLEDGNTRSTAETSFWTRNETITGKFTFDLELKSAVPVEELRMPGFSPTVTKLADGQYSVHLEAEQATLNQDLVLYYRLPDDQPGRVEVIPYRANTEEPGTFMLLVTPGIDLAPITEGHDIVFVLDASGSMAGKLGTLTESVTQALAQLTAKDRFRIVAFDSVAWELTNGYEAATANNVAAAKSAVTTLVAGDSTNLYAGLDLALAAPECERVTEVVLITDGVTNTGVVDPVRFYDLLRERDVRTFGFLLGNNANWPLMEIITDASGGFYASVSNQDDIFGQVMLANSKITHQAMHDSKLQMSGVNIHDTTDFDFGKVYRGQQLVVFGRYDSAGPSQLELATRITGQSHQYVVNFQFPAVAEENPELERLWALDMIHAIDRQRMLGLMATDQAASAIEKLGVDYQLVTDYTAMLVVDDATFKDLGIERNNQQRTAKEEA